MARSREAGVAALRRQAGTPPCDDLQPPNGSGLTGWTTRGRREDDVAEHLRRPLHGAPAAGQHRRSASPHAVQVTALVREFGSPRNPIRAVDNLDLQVHTGEIYGFLGPNGAGKTTLVRMRPTSGSALVAGYDVVRQADDVRRSIAWRSRRRRSTRS